LAGAALGTVNLTWIAVWGYTREMPQWDWWPALIQAHGNAQLYGWTGLFIMGIAGHSLPRMLRRPAPCTWLAKTVFGLVLGGLVLGLVAQPLAAHGVVAPLLPVSAAIQWLGATLFAGYALRTIRRPRDRPAAARGHRPNEGLLREPPIAVNSYQIERRYNMPSLSADTPVGQLVIERPSRSVVFERLGIDYCCGGKRPLREACAGKALDPDQVLRELAASDQAAAAENEADWSKAPLGALVDHIVTTHHDYLREELPRLGLIVGKVVRAHGARHPELGELQQVYHSPAARLAAGEEVHARPL
jgi:hypothetical protein